jgi:hypothetical protein
MTDDAGGPPQYGQQPPPPQGQQPPPQYGSPYPPQFGPPGPQPGYPPPYGPPGYTPPVNYGYAPAPRPTEGHAVVALVLAIASFVVCPLVAAAVALVFAGIAKRNIVASGHAKDGLGMVTAARVISWINIALSLIFLALIVVVVAVGRHVSHSDPSGVV